MNLSSPTKTLLPWSPPSDLCSFWQGWEWVPVLLAQFHLQNITSHFFFKFYEHAIFTSNLPCFWLPKPSQTFVVSRTLVLGSPSLSPPQTYHHPMWFQQPFNTLRSSEENIKVLQRPSFTFSILPQGPLALGRPWKPPRITLPSFTSSFHLPFSLTVCLFFDLSERNEGSRAI